MRTKKPTYASWNLLCAPKGFNDPIPQPTHQSTSNNLFPPTENKVLPLPSVFSHTTAENSLICAYQAPTTRHYLPLTNMVRSGTGFD